MLRRARDVVGFLTSTYRRYRNEDNILIYQMGKVGSTSLAKALGERAIQIHNFYPSNQPCSRKPFYGSSLRRKPVEWLFYHAIRRGVRAQHAEDSHAGARPDQAGTCRCTFSICTTGWPITSAK